MGQKSPTIWPLIRNHFNGAADRRHAPRDEIYFRDDHETGMQQGTDRKMGYAPHRE